MSPDPEASIDLFEYDPEADTYVTTLEWTRHDPSVAVVELLARILEVDPDDLEPLASSIDPVALDALLGGHRRRSRSGECSVSFAYVGHWVTVSSDGRVEITPGDDNQAHHARPASDGSPEGDDRADSPPADDRSDTGSAGDGDHPQAD